MSIIIIYASPNKSGKCSEFSNIMRTAFQSKNLDTEIIELTECHLQSCICCANGWGTCQNGYCNQDLNFQNLYLKMKNADALVFISPVYWHDISEPLKILLDKVRRCDLREGNHWLKDKTSIFICIAKGTSNGIMHCMDSLGYTLNHLNLNVRDRIPVTSFSYEYMTAAAYAAALKMADEIINNKK